jgi:hypothetical protein
MSQDQNDWDARAKGNVRLAWRLVVVVGVVFLVAIWKIRPL